MAISTQVDTAMGLKQHVGVFCLRSIVALVCVLMLFGGCQSHTSGVTQTETKTQIEQLFNLYKAYVETKRKAPQNEQALKEFAKGLSEKEKAERLIGNDVEAIFISSRDKEPFEVVYGQSLNPAGEPVAIIIEKVGKNGMRYAALSIGYSEELDEETLSGYRLKKK